MTRPLREQIAEQVGAAVDDGLFPHGVRMPSTRTLAAALGVSRGVTAEAYDLLAQRGYLHSLRGSGTYVAAATGAGAASRLPREPRAAEVDLRPGQAAGEAFPLAAWRRAWRSASFRTPPTTAMPQLGLPELRHAIAEHVQRNHGVSLTGREVVVAACRAHALRAVLEALDACGPRAAVEEPAPPTLWRAAADGSGRPVAMTVDDRGACLDQVPGSCRAMVLSPGAHLPFGGVLSADRRAQAAQWADRTGGTLIEIAGDRHPSPAAGQLPKLLSLTGPARSVLVGDFCEVLTPALQIGYAIVPSRLAAAVGRRIRDQAVAPPYVSQLAMARLLSDGTVERLMHRLSLIDEQRRRVMVAQAAAAAPLRPLIAGAAGTALLPLPGMDAGRIAAALRDQGVRVSTLNPYHFSAAPVRSALVLGYGHLTEPALRRGLSTLARLLTPAMPTPARVSA
ncbi:PLP-dependent aminotransferase family protein [Catellatospora sp. TT07R-123]|uniref:aminotransferase-like domain-containing protein n=1 Tax=Catellatospora sp. TT07R-123 TaxID=2733863 RepID=UPI001BB43270|nr:PLP-dependent aminotransferase family protein [Catellatospora sp. TT07R-123]